MALKAVVNKALRSVVRFSKTSWVNTLNFNFHYGTSALAVKQDKLITQYKAGITTVGKVTLLDLENDAWVTMAARVAPGNLIIRQWCLIDLFRNSPKHRTDIQNMMKKLAYNPGNSICIWAEGYSYWLYTKDALNLWITKFGDTTIRILVSRIDVGFLRTSYLRSTVKYPAPFGDLRDVPLEDWLQPLRYLELTKDTITTTVSTVRFEKVNGTIKYTITAKPIGMNTHIPKDNSVINITNGIPVGFKFYTGYDNKYPNSATELVDIMDPRRIVSII